jgi:putative Mg2+ transporter-C (MgtC) family protein
MLVTVYESHWVSGVAVGRVQIDPTRMAQGIMTGIGFLGAGVILRATPWPLNAGMRQDFSQC